MSNENDSWFKNAFGIDLGKAVAKIKDDVSAAASSVAQVVGKAQGAVEEGSVAGEPGSFPLGGSVGRGGKNAASDVRAVQAALGIPVDGDCGPKTIAAIKAFQKQTGQAKPDGRVDAGGATERALAKDSYVAVLDAKDSYGGTLASWTVEAPEGGTALFDDKSTITYSTRVELQVDGEVRTDKSFDESTSVEIGAGEKGQLTIDGEITGYQDNFPGPPGVETDERFTQTFVVTWDIAADESGTLSIEGPTNENLGPHKGGTTYRVDSLNPGNTKTKVLVKPSVIGSASQSSLSLGARGLGGELSRERQPPKILDTIFVAITVEVPEKPEPKVKVEIEYVERDWNFEQTIGPFKVGSAKELESGTVEEQVYKLVFEKLPDNVMDDLIHGKLLSDGSKIVEIHGYASNTDKQGENDKLSKRRAKAVVDVLIGRGIPDKVLTSPIPHGEWEVKDSSGMAPTDDKAKERESAAWRKVVLKFRGKFKVPMPKVVPEP